MARFNGPSPEASAHAAMMRLIKAKKGGGCAIVPLLLACAFVVVPKLIG